MTAVKQAACSKAAVRRHRTTCRPGEFWTGTLKMREWKMQHGQNCRGWKMQEWKYRKGVCLKECDPSTLLHSCHRPSLPRLIAETTATCVSWPMCRRGAQQRTLLSYVSKSDSNAFASVLTAFHVSPELCVRCAVTFNLDMCLLDDVR